MAKPARNRVYCIVFSDGDGMNAARHRQHPEDGFKTACGQDILGNPCKNLLCLWTNREGRCIRCRKVMKQRFRGKGGVRRVLSDEQVREVIYLYTVEKLSLMTIAKRFYVGQSTIWKYLDDNKIPRRTRAVPRERIKHVLRPDPVEGETIDFLYHGGVLSIAEVAKIMGMTPGKVRRRMTLYNIPLHPPEVQAKLSAKRTLTADSRRRLSEAGRKRYEQRLGIFADVPYSREEYARAA